MRSLVECLKCYLSVLKENIKTISAGWILFKPNLMSLLLPPNEINSRTASTGGCCLCILTPQEKRIYFSAGIVVTIKIYLVASEKTELSFNWTCIY